MVSQSSFRLLYRVLLVAVAYYGAAWFGLRLRDPLDTTTLVWPATGLAVAALCRWGLGCWPGVFLATLSAERSLSHSWPLATAMAVTNTAGPVATAWLLSRFRVSFRFATRRDGALLGLSAVMGMLVSGAGGALSLGFAQAVPWERAGVTFLRWWLGDTGGVLTLGAFLLTIRRADIEEAWNRRTEAVLFALALWGVGWVAFEPGSAVARSLPLTFVTGPLVVLAAYRFGASGATASAVFVSGVAALATSLGKGPFHTQGQADATFVLWAYIVGNAFLGLMIITLRADQDRSDAALRDSERRLQVFVEEAPLPMALFDRGRNCVAASRHWVTAYGTTESSGVGGLRLPPFASSRERWEETWIHILANRASGSESEAVADRDGSQRWFRWEARPWTDPNGTVGGAVFLIEDITARRRFDLDSEQQRRRLETIIQSAMDAIITVDRSRRVVLFNPAAERIFGRSASTLLGQPMEVLMPERFRRTHPGHFEGFAEGPEDSRAIGRITTIHGLRANGEEFPLEASISKAQIDGSWFFTVTCRDVSERLRADETRKALEARLLQSQKLEAVGQLAGGVAHDFNNLLTVIEGNASLIRARHQGDPELVQEILDASERASRLTRQLLLFSRQHLPVVAELHLGEVVTRLTRTLLRLLGDHVLLEAETEPGLPPISADVGMMEQVLLNLALNARDAMPRGGQLRIRTRLVHVSSADCKGHPDAAPGRYVCLTVQDSGTGIQPEHLPRIFEPFFSTKETGKGTGLGLATVYGIVRQHLGWIHVESRLGTGTAFHVHFPASTAPAATVEVPATSHTEPEAANRAGHPEAAPTAPLGSETLLVVEDDPSVLQLAVKILRDSGYRVLTAESGVAALEVWSRHRSEIRLLVTDMVMPHGVSGIDLARRLRAERADLRVLLTTGYAGEFPTQTSSRTMGFLQKPFAPATLLAAVRDALNTPAT